MKKSLFLVFFILIIVASAIGGFFWVKASFSPKSNTQNFESFLITKGSSAVTIANKLEEGGFIKSALAFKFYTQLTGLSKNILAGEYEISPHMSLMEIVGVLTSAPLEVWVTVPEGLRREEIADKFTEGLSKTGEEKETFRAEFLKESENLEGFLFPDTYLFPKEAEASVVVAKMKSNFDQRMSDFKSDIDSHNLNLEEIITLASILERETRTNTERPVVAGILMNRLRIGMPLQADATAQYAIANVRCKGKVDCDWWPRPITREDLKIVSPYNTYSQNGLPPKPISNPGTSSIKAVLSPEASDYLYYIHEEDGTVHYASTLDGHNENVRKYLGG